MKKTARVRCAAANDDEDEEEEWSKTFSGRKLRRKSADASAADSGDAAAPGPAGGPRLANEAGKAETGRKSKAKDFAWMDSDDDAGDGDGGSGADDGGGEEDLVVSAATLDEVQSFGRMTLLEKALRTRLKSDEQEATIVAAACRALARTRFFDAELLEDLRRGVQQLLKAERLDAMQATDALRCLRELNAYDQGVVSAVAAAFSTKVAMLEPGLRSTWLELFKGMGHEQDQEFLQLLEVPPLLPISPAFRRIRCKFLDRGGCASGAACTYSHDDRAPISLEQLSAAVRSSPLVMTQNQYTMGRGFYGNKSPLPVVASPLPGLPRP